MSRGRLCGKVAIVTGAGQGGGYGAAMAMAREEAAVTLVGRTRSKLEVVAAAITEFGGEALVHPGDVTNPEDVSSMIDETVQRFDGIDILVNAAQSPLLRSGSLLTIEPAVVEELWQSGFVATLALMRAVHPHMLERGGGSIVNFGSGAQLSPKNLGVYAGVKAAIQTMSRAAALEWAESNIRVNVVFPLVRSPAMEAELETRGSAAQRAIDATPLGRIGDPEVDFGRAVVFLAGDDSSYVTGTTLALDGGRAFVR